MGKLHLLHTYVNGNRCHFHHSEAGKKTFNNEHESKSYDFFESSVILSFNLCSFVLFSTHLSVS